MGEVDRTERARKALRLMQQALDKAEESDLLKDAQLAIDASDAQAELDKMTNRQQADWGKLANQVVGAECLDRERERLK